ncbi:MAG: hypothetical protein LBQ54_03930 [Planctomycetaceae bacterium]|nr:hypothetical protein [Planctomycetaceae bacterium]
MPPAGRDGRMELPLRSNDPLPMVAGVRERNNVITGSRTRSREASACRGIAAAMQQYVAVLRWCRGSWTRDSEIEQSENFVLVHSC